jgi:hypothetical protein
METDVQTKKKTSQDKTRNRKRVSCRGLHRKRPVREREREREREIHRTFSVANVCIITSTATELKKTTLHDDSRCNNCSRSGTRTRTRGKVTYWFPKRGFKTSSTSLFFSFATNSFRRRCRLGNGQVWTEVVGVSTSSSVRRIPTHASLFARHAPCEKHTSGAAKFGKVKQRRKGSDEETEEEEEEEENCVRKRRQTGP